MLARTIANDLLPRHVQDRLFSTLQATFLRRFSAQITIIIDEFNGFTLNKLYAAAHLYLGTKISTSATRRLRVSKDDSEKHLSVAMERGETVVDVFQDMKLEWQFIRHENHKYVGNDTTVQQSHSLYLRFREKHKDKVLQDYLPRVLAQAKAMMDEKKTLRLYTVDYEAMRMYGYRSATGGPGEIRETEGQQIAEVEVTPAKVAAELMKSDDPDAAFGGFIEFLKRKVEDEEAKSSKRKAATELKEKGKSRKRDEYQTMEPTNRREMVQASDADIHDGTFI
ncbi:hypothetical protein ACLOJK_001839 [Asimina triloba]